MEHLGMSDKETKPNGKPLVLRMGSRGRVTLPNQVLDYLGWKAGDTLILTLDHEGRLLAQKRP